LATSIRTSRQHGNSMAGTTTTTNLERVVNIVAVVAVVMSTCDVWAPSFNSPFLSPPLFSGPEHQYVTKTGKELVLGVGNTANPFRVTPLSTANPFRVAPLSTANPFRVTPLSTANPFRWQCGRSRLSLCRLSTANPFRGGYRLRNYPK
jgi:hypothetical protein